MHAQSLQSCPTLCNPMDYSPAGFSVHGILQARIQEWVAIPFSRGSFWLRNWTQVPGGSDSKASAYNAGDPVSIPGWGRCPGEGNSNPFQYSCLENPMDRGVHGVTKSRTQLSDFTFTFMHWRRKWQPTPVFLPGESQGLGSLVGCRLWDHTESDTTEVT